MVPGIRVVYSILLLPFTKSNECTGGGTNVPLRAPRARVLDYVPFMSLSKPFCPF